MNAERVQNTASGVTHHASRRVVAPNRRGIEDTSARAMRLLERYRRAAVGVVAALLLYCTFPPTIVYSTCAVGISLSGIVMMSFDSTVTSASFPGASDPLMVSSNPAYAALIV